jgi:hypothetical protein
MVGALVFLAMAVAGVAVNFLRVRVVMSDPPNLLQAQEPLDFRVRRGRQ